MPNSFTPEFTAKNTGHCEGMRHVMEVNDIEFTQLCGLVNATNFLAWLATVDHVDILDIDI